MLKKFLLTTIALLSLSNLSIVSARRVNGSAYNSLSSQTDSTPSITATGTRTRPGVIALSRDLLRIYPYGTRVTLSDPTGKMNYLLKGRVFIVEDTMNARKVNSVDIWLGSYSQAIQFGRRPLIINKLGR